MALMDRVYSVWVGGGEVNDYYLDINEAIELAEVYRNEGYDEVAISQEKGNA